VGIGDTRNDAAVYVINALNNAIVFSSPQKYGIVNAQFIEEKSVLVWTTRDGTLFSIDTASFQGLSSVSTGIEEARVAAVPIAGTLILVGEQRGLASYRLNAGKLEVTGSGDHPFQSIKAPWSVSAGYPSASPDGRWIALGSNFGEMVILSTATLSVVGRRIDKLRHMRNSYDSLYLPHTVWRSQRTLAWGGAPGLYKVLVDENGAPSTADLQQHADLSSHSLQAHGTSLIFVADTTMHFLDPSTPAKELSLVGAMRRDYADFATDYVGNQISFGPFRGDWTRQPVFDVAMEKVQFGILQRNRSKFERYMCDAAGFFGDDKVEVLGLAKPTPPYLQKKGGWFKTTFGDFPSQGEPVWYACVDSDRSVVYLGSSNHLRKYSSTGAQIWKSKIEVPVTRITYSGDGNKVITLSDDGIYRWYDATRGHLLFTLYMGNASGSAVPEFVLFTPDNYFLSNSSRPVNLLGWNIIVDQGRLMSRMGLEMLWDVFNRPDIVRTVVRGNDQAAGNLVVLTLQDAMKSPPPTVKIGTLPSESASNRLKVPYTITPDAGGVAEVRVFHNGKLVMSDGSYKDAIGRNPLGSIATGSNADRTSLRTAIPRAASASDGPALLPISVSVSSAGKPSTASELPADLIVRSAPEKKCNPCTGEIELDVIPGEENTITVVAFNRDNTIQSLPASVTFKSTLPKEAPKLWVLSVGIDQFKSVDLLRNARKDATDFACTYAGKRALQANPKLSGIACDQPGTANGLFKPENINVIDVQLDNFATKANLLAQLNEVAQRAKPQDTFVWFVASHGMMEGTTGLFGIVAHDTLCTAVDPQTQKLCTQMSGYISSNEILEASKQIKAMKQLMVLDTCHSGGLDNKLSGLYDARMSVLAKNMGLHLYASAQATEAAQDGIPGTNGTFTAQLLAGIKGAAKQDAEGNISIVSLGEYAKQKTIEATQPKAKPNTNTAVATNASNAKGSATSTQAAQTPVIQHFGVDAPVARGR